MGVLSLGVGGQIEVRILPLASVSGNLSGELPPMVGWVGVRLRGLSRTEELYCYHWAYSFRGRVYTGRWVVTGNHRALDSTFSF